MSVQSIIAKKSFLLIIVTLFVFVVLPVNAGAAESAKARKSNLEAQSAEIKSEIAVAMDISLNALSNVIATFNDNDTEKEITVKLHAGDASGVKSMVKLLGDAWKSEEDVLRKIEKLATYVSTVTSALNNVEIQLKTSPISKTQLKKAKKAIASARKNVNKASAIAEKLKQDWLVPIENEVPKKK